jgi:hypothetical protein
MLLEAGHSALPVVTLGQLLDAEGAESPSSGWR